MGIGPNLLSLAFKLFGHLLPQSWIKSLWQFASEYNIHIPAQEEHLELRREGDSFLTEKFAHSDIGTPALRSINKCRLYLEVTTLSDILDGSGKRYCNHIMNGHNDNERSSYHRWPQQQNSGLNDWRIWQRSIKIFPAMHKGM